MTQQQEQFKAYTPRRELFALLSDKLPFWEYQQASQSFSLEAGSILHLISKDKTDCSIKLTGVGKMAISCLTADVHEYKT